MILALFFAVSSLRPTIEIISANDTTVVYREFHHGSYETHTEKRAPRDPALIAVLFLGNSLTYFNEMPRVTSALGARENRTAARFRTR